MELYELQSQISDWAEATFDHTEQGIALHLLAEAVELCLAVGIGYAPLSNAMYDTYQRKRFAAKWLAAEEIADVGILLLTLAGYRKEDLEALIEAKMEINRTRDFSTRDNPARFLKRGVN